jgi:hypothetical protein
MDINIKELYGKIKEIFNIATTIAKDIGFEMRKSKMNAVNFLKASIKSFIEKDTPTFNDLARFFKETSGGETITKQGFWNRIKPQTIDFLEQFLKRLLEMAIGKIINIPKLLKNFTQTYILDSTLMGLPNVLKNVYKGFGGNASEAMMKIQCLFNFSKQSYEKIEMGDIKLADTHFAKNNIQHLKEGSLTLFDLGYVCIDVLKNVIKNNSYFLCRFPFWKLKLYEKNNKNKEINLLKLLQSNDSKIVELVAYVGKDKVPVRLVAYPLPKDKRDKIVKKRIKKAKANVNYKNRKDINKNYIKFLYWNIFITNTSSKMIKTKDIIKIYRLRWKIELIFKLWKSNLHIDEINSKKKESVLYSVYFRLIIITFYFLFINSSSDFAYVLSDEDDEDIEYSDHICIGIFKYIFSSILNNIELKVFSVLYLKFLSDIRTYGKKSKSSSRPSTIDILRYHNRGGPMVFNYNNYDISVCCSHFKSGVIPTSLCRKNISP